MAPYSEIKAVLDSSEKDRTMKSNHLAVFAASLQCTDEVKVVSRGIWWLASAAEKDGER